MKYATIGRIGQGAYGYVLQARAVEVSEIVLFYIVASITITSLQIFIETLQKKQFCLSKHFF